MRYISLFFSFFLLLFLIGCKDVSTEVADTKENQKCYSGFFPGTPGKDVTNIYVYADSFCRDPVYALAFSAPPNIIDEIIAKYQLKERANTRYQKPFRASLNRFPWWSADERKQSKAYYFMDDEKRVDYRLWYDPKTEKCQVLIVYM